MDDNSSYLNFPTIETTEHIRRDHRDMCRFSGPDDPEYKKVIAALHRMTMNLSKSQVPVSTPSLSEEQSKKLRDALYFNQIDARHLTIKNAHASTCRWLKQNEAYIDWLDRDKFHDHHGFLWIKGKPGTGKSTLMKFALAQAQESMKDTKIISFFFNARGGELEKSTVGMYRSLLLQLADHFPELGHELYFSSRLQSWSGQGKIDWTVEELKELLAKAIRAPPLSKLVLFIDALDECDEDEIRDMISLFEQIRDSAIATNLYFQVCLSSRHYPHITVSHARELILEGQGGHDEDITNYINSELKIGKGTSADEIRTEIQERASGIFLWAGLVVGMLNKEYDRGRMFALRKRLKEIPDGLHELFRDILIRDTRDKQELIYGLQWVLFAAIPLRLEQFYFAMIARTDPESLEPWDKELLSPSVLRRFVLNCTRGLADATQSENPTVQFIHESVRDFLLKGNDLREILPEGATNFEGTSHNELKNCCLKCIIRFTNSGYCSDYIPSNRREFQLRRYPGNPPLGPEFPFFDYAAVCFLRHCARAQRLGISQVNFLHNFPIRAWSVASRLVSMTTHDVYPLNPSRAFMFARNIDPCLLEVYLQTLSCRIPQDDMIPALLVSYNNPHASRGLMLAKAEIQWESEMQTAFHKLCRRMVEDPQPSTRLYLKYNVGERMPQLCGPKTALHRLNELMEAFEGHVTTYICKHCGNVDFPCCDERSLDMVKEAGKTARLHSESFTLFALKVR